MRSSDYAMKQILQYLVFPEGILYNKQNDTVRTSKINSLFYSIPYLATTSKKIKKTTFYKIAFLVVMSG